MILFEYNVCLLFSPDLASLTLSHTVLLFTKRRPTLPLGTNAALGLAASFVVLRRHSLFSHSLLVVCWLAFCIHLCVFAREKILVKNEVQKEKKARQNKATARK